MLDEERRLKVQLQTDYANVSRLQLKRAMG